MLLQEHFNYITELIAQAKQRAFQAANQELVDLYWSIGEYLYQQVQSNSWGMSIVKELSVYIQRREPNIKGFSPQNLWRMKQFFETYRNYPLLSPLVRVIPWTHHTLIFSNSNSPEEREFYLRLTLKERLSKRDLERQIESSFYQRVMLGNANLSSQLKVLPQDTRNVFKDTYILEILNIPEHHAEKDLKHQISQNISKFLLEFGRDFAFMGEEYPIQVGNQDFAIDLLFFNRVLNCLVAIELKIEKFKPEHLGQLNFYLEALDRDVKMPTENPSIGILLCKGKDDTVVEYALNRSLSPTIVADYQTKLPNKMLLQAKWEEILQSLQIEDL
jgi:predicted nuclease of restriction endonuclease-like (RecB) superfamily